MRGETMSTYKALRDLADFDHPFVVTKEGILEDAPEGVYAPSVYHDDDEDVMIDGDGWEALTGFTGQYGYNGAVMHASEFIGGGLAEAVLTTPGVYVAVVVNVLDDAEGESEPAGWAVLRQVVQS